MSFILQEEAPSHIYRTELPNIIFDLELHPYDLVVYAYLKRVAGDGRSCYQCNKAIAKACGMKVLRVRQAKKTLSQPFSKLKGLSLIKITKQTNKKGGKAPDIVTITNIWESNSNNFLDRCKEPTPLHSLNACKKNPSFKKKKEEPAKKAGFGSASSFKRSRQDEEKIEDRLKKVLKSDAPKAMAFWHALTDQRRSNVHDPVGFLVSATKNGWRPSKPSNLSNQQRATVGGKQNLLETRLILKAASEEYSLSPAKFDGELLMFESGDGISLVCKKLGGYSQVSGDMPLHEVKHWIQSKRIVN